MTVFRKICEKCWFVLPCWHQCLIQCSNVPWSWLISGCWCSWWTWRCSSSVDPHSLFFKSAPYGYWPIPSCAWVGQFCRMCSGFWTPVPYWLSLVWEIFGRCMWDNRRWRLLLGLKTMTAAIFLGRSGWSSLRTMSVVSMTICSNDVLTLSFICHLDANAILLLRFCFFVFF